MALLSVCPPALPATCVSSSSWCCSTVHPLWHHPRSDRHFNSFSSLCSTSPFYHHSESSPPWLIALVFFFFLFLPLPSSRFLLAFHGTFQNPIINTLLPSNGLLGADTRVWETAQAPSVRHARVLVSVDMLTQGVTS